MITGLNAGVTEDGHSLYEGGWQGLAYRVSTMMSMFFADAIARYTTMAASQSRMILSWMVRCTVKVGRIGYTLVKRTPMRGGKYSSHGDDMAMLGRFPVS